MMGVESSFLLCRAQRNFQEFSESSQELEAELEAELGRVRAGIGL